MSGSGPSRRDRAGNNRPESGIRAGDAEFVVVRELLGPAEWWFRNAGQADAVMPSLSEEQRVLRD